MAIISLSGRAGAGKDEVARIIQKLTTPKPFRNVQDEFGRDQRELVGGKFVDVLEPTKSPWEVKKWAGVLKHIVSLLLSVPLNKMEDQEFKGKTLRQLADEGYITESTLQQLIDG